MMLIWLFLLLKMNSASAQQGSPSTPIFTSVTPQATFISLTWSQPTEDTVLNYTISYSYVTRSCEGVIGGDIITGIDGSIRTFNLTSLEENSDFTINITAVNGAGAGSASTVSNTPIAAPSAGPASLNVTSISPTSIAIAWERVRCADRNAEVTRYVVIYNLVSDPSARSFQLVFTINTYNSDVIGELIPRTNYSIQVRADHDNLLVAPLIGTMLTAVNARTAVPEVLGFYLRGNLYPNNSVVLTTAIGQDKNALICLTNLEECCSTRESSAGKFGIWRLPNELTVPSSGSGLTITRGPSAILLHRRNNAEVPTGVFTCEIPDADNVTRLIYIYTYVGQVPGSPFITDLSYNPSMINMTCTSTGQPIDSVIWSKEGSEIRADSTDFSQTQIITDRMTSTYQHFLSSESASNFVGSFTCEVRDGSGGTASRTLILNGVTITNDPIPFTVGQNAVMTCTSNFGVVDRIEWQSIDGVVLVSGTSVEQLQLTLRPVNDSLSVHGSDFICSVTRNVGTPTQEISLQTLPVTVTIPSPAISANISNSGELVAGLEYNLTCTVSELIVGLTDMPRAGWTRAAGDFIASEIFTSRSDNISVAVLNFNPMRASYVGGYICSGSLDSPAEQTPHVATARKDIRVQSNLLLCKIYNNTKIVLINYIMGVACILWV